MTPGRTLDSIRSPRAAGLLALLTLAAACGDDPAAPVSRPPLRPVETVQVAADSPDLLVGATTRLSALPLAADRSPLPDRPVAWSSGDSALASVSPAGIVTARAPGTVTVTARSEGKAGSVTLRIAPREVASVRIVPLDTLLEVGASRLLRAEALAADGSPIPGRPVRWISSDPASLRVESDGRATALREGITVVNAEIDGHLAWARVVVPPDLSGEWTLAVYDLLGGGVHCRLEGMRLSLSRDGLAISGEAHPAEDVGIRVGCDIVGTQGPFVSPVPPVGPLSGTLAPAVDAAVLETTLRFEHDRWLLQGRLIGGAVTGTAWLDETIAGVPVTRRGTFVMTRAR